jgi:autotransporter-associated beta strand protein
LPAGTPLTIGADDNGSGGGGIFDLNGNSQTIGPLASSTGIGGTGTNIPTIKLTGALTVIQTNINTTFAGVITGSGGSLTVGGSGTPSILTLSGANTYTGKTTINAGTLALGSTGSINNSTGISIAAGATFDVSAINSFTLSANTTLSAGGTTAAATINGGTTVNLRSQPIILTYDGLDPALILSQGALVLNGNAFTVNGSALAVGAYNIIQQTSGNIAGSGSYSVTGTAIPPTGVTAAISVSGGNVILTIANSTATTLNSLTPSTYGQTVTFTATVAPALSGGMVQFYDNGVALGSPVSVSGGTASYATSALSVGNHPITASYSGIAGYAASATTNASIQQVNTAALNITAAAQSKAYGALLTFGAGSTQFSSVGLQNGETVGSVTLAVSSNGGATNAPVGTYTITPSLATGGTFASGNYNIAYTANTLTVTLPSNTIPVTITGIGLLADGTVQLNFSGTPGYVYLIEAAPDLTPPISWTTLDTNAADTNGDFEFIDTDATNYSGRYYRTATQ